MTQPGMELPPPAQVMQMMMGHWVAQVLGTVATLGVADHMQTGPRSSAELAEAVHAKPDALHRLLRAAAAVGIFVENGDRYSLTPLGDCLRSDAPVSMRDIVIAELSPGHWLPWGRLPDAIRTGKPQAEEALGMDTWAYYAKHAAEGACFARGMGNLSTMAAMQVTAAIDFSAFGTIVDVGGSQGVLVAAALRAAPKSRGIILDRPEVIAAGAATVKSYGFGDRLVGQGGDFFESVPAGDAYLLKTILHDWDDERAIAILKSIARAAKPGAKIFIVEGMLGDTPMATAVKLLDVNMLVMLGGRERTAAEYAALLGAAGLRFEREVSTMGLFGVVEGTQP